MASQSGRRPSWPPSPETPTHGTANGQVHLWRTPVQPFEPCTPDANGMMVMVESVERLFATTHGPAGSR